MKDDFVGEKKISCNNLAIAKLKGSKIRATKDPEAELLVAEKPCPIRNQESECDSRTAPTCSNGHAIDEAICNFLTSIQAN